MYCLEGSLHITCALTSISEMQSVLPATRCLHVFDDLMQYFTCGNKQQAADVVTQGCYLRFDM